ncbi:PREDICTED: uncharacterized protein LOC106818648 [Priapulus caudatus]|uniref:Uncharacterized protein LOC106818648 n=1 Tax=Priapulus caudatus TaxID=37621 RepID=A0ABM1F2Z9_PRICU|nr:PREDICTED: uncharacterized protein LOC106818648 [Priapulus caudatus]
MPPPPLQYEVIDPASQRGRVKLADDQGFTYTLYRSNDVTTTWRCSVRNKRETCLARVKQNNNDNTFIAGPQPHCHQPVPGASTALKVIADVKRKATRSIFRSAPSIVSEVLAEKCDGGPIDALPCIDHLARTANRKRQQMRRPHPRNLDFDIDNTFVADGFMRRDIRVRERRHLLFALPLMITLLAQTTRWYLDSTFKVVRAPFIQLFSVHAFVQSDGYIKQVPLAFAPMSGKNR